MSLVADKYSENDPVPCSIDDLAVTEIRDELKKIGVKTRIKNREKLLDLFLFISGEILSTTTQNLGICFFCTENSNIR
jgi:hypothetical protein